MRTFILLCFVLVLGGCDSNNSEPKLTKSEPAVATVMPSRTVVIESADDIFTLFTELNYTRKEWADGSRLVPRIYMAGIPARWQKTSHDLPVARKKEIFFRLLGPLVLHANELIEKDRTRLFLLGTSFDSLGEPDQEWLLALAQKYKVVKTDSTTLSTQDIEELHVRVDIIPVSLALSQGAEESGWATSRFAVLGNALFGQWDFSGNGIKPERQRKELGNYGLARFDTPLDSVIAYMRNLNTHRAYLGLREYRAELRSRSEEVTGYELAKKLDKYSERGQKYVEGLHAIMRINKLAGADQAHLSNKEIIYLVHNAELVD